MRGMSRAERFAEYGNLCFFDPISAGISSLGLGAVSAGDVSAGLGVVGAAGTALGAIGQGEAEAQAARYQAQVAKNNATIANQNAAYAAEAGAVKAENIGQQAREQAGAVTASLAAGGVDVNTGSAEDVRRSQAMIGEQEQATVRQNAALQVYGYRTQGVNYQAQAGLEEAKAAYAPEAGWIKGLGGLLTASSRLPGFGGGNNSLNFATGGGP